MPAVPRNVEHLARREHALQPRGAAELRELRVVHVVEIEPDQRCRASKWGGKSEMARE